jgi:hypothetical protein
MTKGFLIFHLNLAFSSIEEDKHIEVINKCYWPMLNLIEKTNICVGIEMTGWTLKRILKLDKSWVNKFKFLLSQNKCELIGSGWSQIIGPIVPYEINIKNHKIALDYYYTILSVKPKLVLVNEMSFSRSMIDIYIEIGYLGFIMDGDNVKLALNLDSNNLLPTHALGNNNNVLPVLWSDSILFQKFQRVIHKDISEEEYFDYLITYKNNRNNNFIPIYTNDIEIFDFRPGRFTTESKINNFSEWESIRKILTKIQNEIKINIISPSEVLEIINNSYKRISQITSIKYPIPVKKQLKYNINRWAISGRNDLWLNTVCYKLHKNLLITKNQNDKNWKYLCEFWSSDYRTHITDIKWKKLIKNLEKNCKEIISINDINQFSNKKSGHNRYEIINDDDGIYSTIKTDYLTLVLNKRRGATIKSLSFKSHNNQNIIGTINQGYFNSIEYGVDYYSGGVLIESPQTRKKFTDLEYSNPLIEVNENNLIISLLVNQDDFTIKKTMIISLQSEMLSISYDFVNFKRVAGIVRVGLITFLEDFLNSSLKLECFNGGNNLETFDLNMNVNHGMPVSAFVSSTASLGISGGLIKIFSETKSIFFRWDNAKCAAAPMFKYLKIGDKILSRLSFSLCELDDTFKEGGKILPFTFTISTQ